MTPVNRIVRKIMTNALTKVVDDLFTLVAPDSKKQWSLAHKLSVLKENGISDAMISALIQKMNAPIEDAPQIVPPKTKWNGTFGQFVEVKEPEITEVKKTLWSRLFRR
jgi:hypothetical protein